MRTIAQISRSIVHIIRLLKKNINIFVVVLIVDDSLSIDQVFWKDLIYSNLTVHSIVFLLLETILTTFIYLAYFDLVIREC